MRSVFDQLSLLGLNSREVRVFSVLATFGNMRMTALALRADLPRTTVDSIVRRLCKQGIVNSVTIKRHREYGVDLGVVSAKLRALEHTFSVGDTHTPMSSPVESGLRRPRCTLKHSIPEAFEMFAGDRMSVVVGQGRESTLRVARRLCGYLMQARQCRCHVDVTLTRTIARALTVSAIPKSLRCADVHIRLTLVPELFGLMPSDALLFREYMVLVDVLHGNHEGITNMALIEAFKHTVRIASETGWSIDLNEWIEV